MGTKFDKINQEHKDFVQKQHLFFIGSAGADTFINVSPKGMDSLKIVNENRVIWLNHTGSGNETSAHVQENGRMTIMWCSFDKEPLILKFYGTAKVIHPRDKAWDELSTHFKQEEGARQFFDMHVSLVLASCGYAVPRYEFKKERDTLLKWSAKKTPEGIKAYWEENNMLSLNRKETHIFKD